MVVMLDDHTTIHTAFCRVVPGGRGKRREGERGERRRRVKGGGGEEGG